MKLQDRTVVVTGASSGIGRETAIALAKRGARVIAVARREDRLKTLAAEVARVEAFVADVTDDDDRARLVADAGPIDALVNVAGVGWAGPVDKIPLDEVRRIFELNVFALIDLTNRVLPQMLERRRGHICNMGSIAGFVGAPPLTMYSATKFAVQGYTEGLRREMNGRGVHVSLVAPGPAGSEFIEAAPVAGGLAEGLRGTFEAGNVLPPWLAANAVVRAIERDASFGYAEISAPRALGLYRLGQLPGVNRVVDLVAYGLRALTDDTVPDPAPSGERPRPVEDHDVSEEMGS